MNEKKLESASEADLKEAIEENVLAFLETFSTLEGTESWNEGDHVRYFTGIPFPLFNGTFRTHFLKEQADERIDAIVQFFSDRGVPFIWVVGPKTQPDDTENRLARKGFNVEPGPGMAVEISKLKYSEFPPDLSVRVADTEDLRMQFAETMVAGFGFPAHAVDVGVGIFSKLVLDDAVSYVGFIDGKPVATSSVYNGAGVAGIYNVATLPEERGKGYGAAMAVRPLLDSREDGYRFGILQSSKMGLSVYRKLGFEEYCKIGMHAWAPS